MDDANMCREKGLQRRLEVIVVWSEISAGDMSSLGPHPIQGVPIPEVSNGPQSSVQSSVQ